MIWGCQFLTMSFSTISLGFGLTATHRHGDVKGGHLRQRWEMAKLKRFMPWKYPPNLVNLVTIMIAFTFNWLGRELHWLLLHHICRKLTRHSECKSRCVRLGFCNKISSCSTFPNVCAAQLDPDMCFVFSSNVHTFFHDSNQWVGYGNATNLSSPNTGGCFS